MVKGKGEMTTYWLTGTKPEQTRGQLSANNSDSKIDGGTEERLSITKENQLNPHRARKQAIAHNQHEQVGTS